MTSILYVLSHNPVNLILPPIILYSLYKHEDTYEETLIEKKTITYIVKILLKSIKYKNIEILIRNLFV